MLSVKVHPNVVVSLATAFIRGGYTIDQMFDGWSQRAKVLGIREYYSVNVWTATCPGPRARDAAATLVGKVRSSRHSSPAAPASDCPHEVVAADAPK